MAQFHVPDGFRFPSEELMVADSEGIKADSCDVRLYLDTFYGDSLATMKLRVRELDRQNTLEENKMYYTNVKTDKYVDEDSPCQKVITYSVKDLTRPESETDGKTYYRQIAVKLPVEYGTQILRNYYDNPDNFANSYKFIHEVCPGFYFESAGGVGAMVKTAMMAMNVYFRYHSKTAEGNDTIIDGVQRFGGTEEVIQTTKVDNQIPGGMTADELNSRPGTYVRTPAGYFTELTLPVEEMVGSESGHARDSINLAKLTIRRYEQSGGKKSLFEAPSYLLMVRKDKLVDFFENNRMPDSYDSYLSSECTASAPYYNYTNIAQLITVLKIERDKEAGVTDADSEAERRAKYANWEAKHPNWNKVVLVPIEPVFTTSVVNGISQKTLRAVKQQLGLTSAKLEGGKDTPITLEVVFSRRYR